MEIIISILLLSGSFFIFLSALGIIRFKDLYSRMHSTTKASSFGLLLLLVGVSLFFNELNVYVKTILVVVFIYLTAPLAAHAIAKSYREKDKE